jgi:predicted transcriptional regulator
MNSRYRSSRRDKFEIWSSLLETCFYTSRTQTWLLRNLGLNTAAIKQALNQLTKGGMLMVIHEPEQGRTEYKTTEEGKEGLKQYYLLISKFFGPKTQ